jgi:phospholipid/cholesterol/gamma-HCH transport system ATP-binding protein
MIKVTDLWKSYNHNMVLKGLNLEIKEGETVVILGRSGVGKSVLLRLLMGIEKPDRGTIEVDGNMISSLTGNELYKALTRMGMLFQASALFDSMTVGENTAFYLKQHPDPETGKPFSPEEIKQKVKQALSMVGLEGTEDMMPSDLSGGMKKRAALARLIISRPKVLFYDEPTTGLDPILADEINDLIVFFQKELHATSVVVTHDICSAFHVGDRIALHHDGKIFTIVPKEEFAKIDHPLVQSFLKHAMPEVPR